MSSMMTVDINSRGAMTGFLGFAKKTKDDSLQALEDTAREGLRLTQFEVPHDEGTLQNSGTVDIMGDVVIMGYHEKYAARLHEHPEYRFQKGRKGKYIEDPIRNNASALRLTFGKALQTRMF